MKPYFKEAGLFILSKNPSPSILLEMGFLNNESDFRSLTDKLYQQKLAGKLVLALEDYRSRL